MAEQQLDRAQVGAGFEQMHGEPVAQRVGREALANAGALQGVVAGLADGGAGDVAAGNLAGEQPAALRARAPPVVAEGLQKPGREHDVAVLGSLARDDAQRHALAVDVRRAQADGLRDAQSGRVRGRQDRLVREGPGAGWQLRDFLRAGNHGQLLRLLGRRQDGLDVPVSLERDTVEEPQGGDGDGDRAGGQPLLGGEEHLVVADWLGAEPVGRAADVAGEQGDLVDIGYPCAV